MSLDKRLPKRVLAKSGIEFWPKYCSFGERIGHNVDNCFKKNPNLQLAKKEQHAKVVYVPKSKTQEADVSTKIPIELNSNLVQAEGADVSESYKLDESSKLEMSNEKHKALQQGRDNGNRMHSQKVTNNANENQSAMPTVSLVSIQDSHQGTKHHISPTMEDDIVVHTLNYFQPMEEAEDVGKNLHDFRMC